MWPLEVAAAPRGELLEAAGPREPPEALRVAAGLLAEAEGLREELLAEAARSLKVALAVRPAQVALAARPSCSLRREIAQGGPGR